MSTIAWRLLRDEADGHVEVPDLTRDFVELACARKIATITAQRGIFDALPSSVPRSLVAICSRQYWMAGTVQAAGRRPHGKE